MGLLSRFAKMVPHNSAVDVADTFLSGTAGAGAGAAIGGMTTPDGSGAVPGMFAGAGVGAGGSRVLMMIIRELKRANPEAPEEAIIEGAMQLAKKMGRNGGM
jgi:hypothetical protein